MKKPIETGRTDLPEFVIADDGLGRDFAIHLHAPMFVLEIGHEDSPFWIDEKPPEPKAGQLLRNAAKFFLQQIARNESTKTN